VGRRPDRLEDKLTTGQDGSRGEVRQERARVSVMQHLRLPAYLAAALFIIVSLLDIGTLAWPPDPGTVTWRFGTIGAASNYILTLFFGMALLCWTAAFFGHRRTLRVAGVCAIITALVLSLLVVDFVLSVLQLRGGVPPAERSAFALGTIKATLKYTLFAFALLVTGVQSWRASRRLETARR
jgi:hypothetical protein